MGSAVEIETEAGRDRSGVPGKGYNYSAAPKHLVNSIKCDPARSRGDRQFHAMTLASDKLSIRESGALRRRDARVAAP
jgi:hypothetical protein